MIRTFSLFTLVSSLFFLSNEAIAHQEKAAITQVLLNERSGHLEVVHRFYIHDAEHAVKLITGSSDGIFESEETQAAFYEHVINNFSLFIEEQSLELTPLGFEVEGNFFWAYQEIAIEEPFDSIDIRHSSLQEFWPEQVNTVNFEAITGQVKTAIFEATSELIRIKF